MGFYCKLLFGCKGSLNGFSMLLCCCKCVLGGFYHVSTWFLRCSECFVFCFFLSCFYVVADMLLKVNACNHLKELTDTVKKC